METTNVADPGMETGRGERRRTWRNGEWMPEQERNEESITQMFLGKIRCHKKGTREGKAEG